MEPDEIKKQAENDINSASDMATLNGVKVKYLGKKGIITGLFAALKDIEDREQKKEQGRKINELKQAAEKLFAEKEKSLVSEQKSKELKDIDVTLPAYSMEKGTTHPITRTMEEINSIFLRMGFSVEEGPDIETSYNNFKALNFPEDHPAMDMHDTFHMDDEYLLRTHTSPIQIRAMKKHKPPLKIIAPGRVYRRDAIDATHSPVFHQVEGFMVDENVRFSDLKGVLGLFIREMFGPQIKSRFRPSFFPFTEPSAEVDMQCVHCMGKGCPACGKTGWLEILGAGMIHVNVFKAVGYDPEKYTGFAFGMGVERVAMLKYGINDMRLFFENDVRFLRQFR